MSWNYRIMMHKKADKDYFGLHEVYYDENGNVMGWAENPETGLWDTPEELTSAHDLMLKDCLKNLKTKEYLEHKG